jgi:hypothetical protein
MGAVSSWQSTVQLIKKQTNKNSDKFTVDYRSIVTRKCDFVKTRPEQKGGRTDNRELYCRPSVTGI